MSTIVRNSNIIDPMPSNIDTPARMFGSTVRKTTGLLSQDRERINENFRSNIDLQNMPTGSRTFGLGSRYTTMTSSSSVQNNRLVQESYLVEGHRNVPSSFGLGSRIVATNNSALSIPNNSRGRNMDQVNVSSMSRAFGLVGRETSSNLTTQNNLRLNQDLRNTNDNMRMSVLSRPFGLQTRNSTLHSAFLTADNSRLNQEPYYKNNDSINISSISRTFGPAARNTTLSTGLQIQDSIRFNDEMIDNGGFRKPTLSRVIRGRSSTMSSRLFSKSNVDRFGKDLSNINGFNVTHFSKKALDSLPESRLALNTRQNWMDNQSVNGSLMSTSSMKAQFMSVLETLHHSILSIGHVPVEAVRIAFDNAKQGLENISEMSYAPSIRENDAASVISHSSRINCTQIPKQRSKNVMGGDSFHLKSSADLLSTLMNDKPNREDVKSINEKVSYKLGSFDTVKDDHDSALVFVKPKPYSRKRRSLKTLKLKTPQVSKTLTSKVTSQMINLKDWYPIAVGSDLAFSGVDEEGAIVKTDPVKKRVNNRKVELINGMACNLIGNPSTMISVLPQKIMNSLKNGLTDRWRVLQKELLSCQTAVKEVVKKRQSKSPKVKSSSKKSPKVKSSPKKIEQAVSTVHTRSGRTVKPPSSYWIASGSEEVSSSKVVSTPRKPINRKQKNEEPPPAKKTKNEGTPTKKPKLEETPVKKSRKRVVVTPKKLKSGSPVKKTTASPRKPSPSKASNKKNDETPVGRTRKGSAKVNLQKKSSREIKKLEETEEVVQVHSSTEETKKREKSRKSPVRGKRKMAADADSTLRKRSKLDKSEGSEVESTVKETRMRSRQKKRKSKVVVSARQPKPKLKKSPLVKKGKALERKKTGESERKMETKDVNEFEEDFEFQLDDIEIPEIANVSGNPQLTRSQLRLVSMETPPLKYFNSNLRIMTSSSTTTPVRSPDWCLSQRTESEVKRFQRRREEAFKKRIKMSEVKRTVVEKTTTQSKDLKRVLEWVADKNVRSPQWNSKVLQYVIPSRKQMEQDDEDEEEDVEAELL